MACEAGVLTLEGVVQHYDWGGCDYIPRLLGLPNHDRKPFAELWIGAHPRAASPARCGAMQEPLDAWIARDPEAMLGYAANQHFAGRLPYLFKILDVHKMLSIQAHPTLPQARAGFARENAAGVPLAASHRNYKDDNHKPEIGVALTDFWMLHGFKPLEEIARSFTANPELEPVMPGFAARLAETGHDHQQRRHLLRELYANAMTMPQEQVDRLLNPLLQRIGSKPELTKNSPDYWALRAAENFPLPGGHRDRGIFSLYFLNLLHLKPGQGSFQPAGVLHAYLEGVNVELMANSDNVLRGGLTSKHVDVAELLNILVFEGGAPQVLDGVAISPHEHVYPTPAEEFELSRISLRPGQRHAGEADYGPKALLVLTGSGALSVGGKPEVLRPGSIRFLPCGTQFVLERSAEDGKKGAAGDEEWVVFAAALPRHARGAA